MAYVDTRQLRDTLAEAYSEQVEEDGFVCREILEHEAATYLETVTLFRSEDCDPSYEPENLYPMED